FRLSKVRPGSMVKKRQSVRPHFAPKVAASDSPPEGRSVPPGGQRRVLRRIVTEPAARGIWPAVPKGLRHRQRFGTHARRGAGNSRFNERSAQRVAMIRWARKCRPTPFRLAARAPSVDLVGGLPPVSSNQVTCHGLFVA